MKDGGSARYDSKPLRVKELPRGEQPRELVDRFGAESVEPAVLLAVILRTGSQGRNVLDLARGLVRHYGGLHEMAAASVDELTAHDGMGPVKAQVLKCALELSRRLAEEGRVQRPRVRTPEEVVAVMQEEVRRQDVEVFWVLMLDSRYQLLRPPHIVTRGIVDASLVHPREVFKEAVRASSSAVVLAHNHPSGDTEPSREDLAITRAMIEAGKLMDIEVLDHVILGRPNNEDPAGFCSMRESGLLTF